MENVTLILTPIDAELWKKFQQHHDIFLILQQKGVFDIGYGKAELNFAAGTLQNVVKSEVVYKRT